MRFLKISILCAMAINYSTYAQEYFKIYFSEEGIYRLSGQELVDWGISISQIQPEKIQMFSDGQNILPYATTEPQPQLQEIAILVADGGDGQFDLQDYILFYGLPLNRVEWDAGESAYRSYRNPYDTLACYWLRWNVEPGKRMSLKDGSLLSGSAILRQMFTDYLHLEKDHYNNIKSGLIWSWHVFGQQNTFTHSFELSGVSGSQATATARLIRIPFYYNTEPAGLTELSVNHTPVGSATNNATLTATVPIQTGLNSLEASYTPSTAGDTLQQSGFDWLELAYPRYTHIVGDELKILIDGMSGIFHTRYRRETDPDAAEIFDISDPFNVAQIQTGNDSLFEDTLSAEHKIYYLNREGFSHTVARIEAGQRDIFSPADGAAYVIITRQQTVPHLQPLKAHREAHNGFSVKIVTVEDIMDDFGVGRNDPTAIRNFIKFAYDNWNPRPQFILLAGNGYYDYRNISEAYPVNWVPAFEISAYDNLNSRATDDYFVDVSFVPSFNSIHPQIPIGRFPANTPEALSALVEKTIRSETNFKPGLWRLNALLIADDEFSGPGSSGNEFLFLEQMEFLASNRLPAETRTYKLYEREHPFVGNEKPAATRQLINWFNQGNRISALFGHGDEAQWTHENLLNFQRDLASIRNIDKFSIFTGWSMLYPYDNRNQGILQNLLTRSNSGFSAVFTANRASFIFQSEYIMKTFYQKLFDDAQGVVGKAVMMAKGSDSNSQKFHLLGDPALHIALPENRIQFTSISPDTLKAGGLVQISGQISAGQPGDSLIVEVREPGKLEHVFTGSGYINYETTGGVLYRGYVPQNNGQFNLQFMVSNDVPHDSVSARGKIFAYTWNGINEGMGFMDSLRVGGADSSITDMTPPQITLFVTGGDTVGRDAYLVAELFDENGMNLSHFKEHYPILFLDGNTQDTVDIADFFTYHSGNYQAGILKYPLPYLPSGNHRITVKVHDNYNNAASDSISFVTGLKPSPEFAPDRIILAQNYPNPFNLTTNIRFQISGSRRYRVKLDIFNILGQRVNTLLNEIKSPGEYEMTWNGRDCQGNTVASGLYIYRLWVSSHAVQGVPNQRGGIYQYAHKMLLIK